MRPCRRSRPNLLTLAALFLGIVALTFALVGCEDTAAEPNEPGDMAPPGHAEPMEPGPGDEPGDPAAPPGEAVQIPPIDEATIKNLTAAASAFSASQINVMDYGNFGDWAAAYVGVSGQESQLAVFHYPGSAWTLVDMGSYVDPGDLPPGIPPQVRNWAFP